MWFITFMLLLAAMPAQAYDVEDQDDLQYAVEFLAPPLTLNFLNDIEIFDDYRSRVSAVNNHIIFRSQNDYVIPPCTQPCGGLPCR